MSVCSALEPEDLPRLDRIVSHIQVSPGQLVFLEGDPADHLFVLTDGCIKLYKMLIDGRRQITGFLFPSDFLGLAMRERYAFSAEAVAVSALCRFPKRQLEQLLVEIPALERRLLGVASNELAAAQDQMLLLGRKTAQEKLGSFLHSLLRRTAPRSKAQDRIHLPMSRADIADYLGLTVETVSRCFTRLRKDGVVDFTTPQDVLIRDLGMLSDLSGVSDEY
ncbi:MAG: helix-turn-helix domain-containing protein [Alphaproteobacteria bacterium]|nr:helix-turn-helix domain-containing protein [Alphaproteobacteria bacterium]